MYDWYELYGDCYSPYAETLASPSVTQGNTARMGADAYQPWENEAVDPEYFVTSSAKIIPRRVWLSRVSKQLSWILRHRASELGLSLRADGGVPLAELLALPIIRKLRVALCHVEEIIQENAKGRFTMWNEVGVLFIRANQGHSIAGIEDAYLLQEIVEPLEVCCHGSYFGNWKAISQKGLLLMGRNHIHFTSGDPAAYDSPPEVGMRADAELFIYVDMAKAMAAGIKFFYSANGVVLSRGDRFGAVPPSMFKKVVSMDGRIISSAPENAPKMQANNNHVHTTQRSTTMKTSWREETRNSKRGSVYITTEIIPLTDNRSSTTDADDVSTTASTSPVHKSPKARRPSRDNGKNNYRQSVAFGGGMMWYGNFGHQMENTWWQNEYEQYGYSNACWEPAAY
eukprot:GEMP01032279.1.p1 GENE.GEMP01032279.1~~GEMP01032279.1.p1  ORF type:complete len:398 (+),score=92.06 GEMP01032279.1:60-1253(+)